MPRFYFHLSAPDAFFPDSIGFEVDDVSAAHLRAVQLADRVMMMMMMSGLAIRAPDLQRWAVQVVDQRQQSIMTVIFPSEFEKRRVADHFDGARAVQERLATSGYLAARDGAGQRCGEPGRLLISRPGRRIPPIWPRADSICSR